MERAESGTELGVRVGDIRRKEKVRVEEKERRQLQGGGYSRIIKM